MNRYILTVLLIMIISSSASANFKKNNFSGKLSGHIEYTYDQEGDYHQTEVEVGYIFGWRMFELEPYAGWRTMFEMGKADNKLSGWPFNDRYTIGVELRVWKHIYVRVEHNCTHHVVTAQRDMQYNGFTTEEFDNLYSKYSDPNHTQFTIGYYF